MILYIDDLRKEIDILNWYKGEAEKRNDVDADVVQSDAGKQDAILYFIRKAVTDVLLLLNTGSSMFTCTSDDDILVFNLSPVREDRRYMLDVLKEAIRQYIVFEVRRLWMMTVRPAWADSSIREELRNNMRDASRSVSKGETVRRRATNLAGI